MTFTIDKETVLFALAIYGAVLSTWNLFSALRKERRAVRITTSSATPVGGGMDWPSFTVVEVTNAGHRPVTIETIGLELPNRRWLHPGLGNPFPGLESTRLPVTLTDGASARIYYAKAALGEELLGTYGNSKLRLVPFAKDSVGTTHRGKSWKANPERLAQM